MGARLAAGKGRSGYRTALQRRRPDPGRRRWRSGRVCRERAGRRRTRWEPRAGTDAGALEPLERKAGPLKIWSTAAREGRRHRNRGTGRVPVLLRRSRVEPGASRRWRQRRTAGRAAAGARFERKDAVCARPTRRSRLNPRKHSAYAAAQANQGFLAPGYAPLVTPAEVTAETTAGGKEPVRRRSSTSSTRRPISRMCLRIGRAAAGGLGAGTVRVGSRAALFSWSACCRTGCRRGILGTNRSSAMKTRMCAARSPLTGRACSSTAPKSKKTAKSANTTGLYMRDTTTRETIAAQRGAGRRGTGGEESEVAFQAASSDGSQGVLHRHRAADPRIRAAASVRRDGQPGRPVRVRNHRNARAGSRAI